MITIQGIIGEKPKDANPEDKYVNLLSVIEQVQAEGQNDIHVLINSIGGDVDTGFAIYNYLINLPNKIITECRGECASIASVIFLAGEVRIAGCPLMIHNPYIEAVGGDKKMLEAAAEWIGEVEKRLERTYTERTNLDADVLSYLMDEETYISPSQAVSLGFATQAAQLAQAKRMALAKLNIVNIINKNPKKMEKSRSERFRELLGLKAKPKAKAMSLTAADGSVLSVSREEGDPQVGDEASPDGTFTMPDGSVITVVDGVITEITQASNQEAEVTPEEIITVFEELEQENEELKQENEELKAEIAQAKAKLKSDSDLEILNAIAKAGGTEWLAKQCSHYKPKGRIGIQSKKDEQGVKESAVAKKLAAIKEKRGIN